MRGGYKDALRRRVQRLNVDEGTRIYLDALVRKNEDIRQRRDEWEAAGVTRTNVTADDTGGIALTGTPTAKISHAVSDGYITDLDQSSPADCLMWELDPTIGPNPVLSKFTAFLNRKFNGGQPVFDGQFVLTVYRIGRYGNSGKVVPPSTMWELIRVTDSLPVSAATMAADQDDVAFTFSANPLASNVPPGPYIGSEFYPQAAVRHDDPTALRLDIPAEKFSDRCIVFIVRAVGGTNTNYGWGRDSAQSATKVGGAGTGTIRHRVLTTTPQYGSRIPAVSTPTNMLRCAIQLAAYSATGSVQLTGTGKVELGASVQGTVEFVARIEPPAGTTALTYARVNGADAWVQVKDGQTPTDVGLAVSQFYEMKADLTANSNLDTSPVVRALGIMDRVTYDISEVAELTGLSESVDPISGEVQFADGVCRIQHTGLTDYRDIATRLIAENNFTLIEIRERLGHKDLPMSDALLLNIYRVDDYKDFETYLDLKVVSVLERLKGKFPLPSGSLFGYFLKAGASDLSGGADFSRELSEVVENSSTLAVSVAASATEDSVGFTPPGVPGFQRWAGGSWTIKVNVTSGNTNLQLSVAVARVNSAGTQQEISRFTAEQQATAGGKVFTLNALPWNTGQQADRLKIVYRFRNTAASVQAATLEFGTVNTEVIAPWTPLTKAEPVLYNSQSIQSVYLDWRDSKIGLSERYRGAPPADSTILVGSSTKLLNADGKRTLERIAYLDGCIVIGSQGLVKCVNLVRARAANPVSFLGDEIKVIDVDPGLRTRIPELLIGYGWGKNKPETFQAYMKIVHAAALAAYGYSSIDNPERELEKDIAQFIPDPGVAQLIGEPLVQALGTGFIRIKYQSLVPHPELELGDPVVVETDRFIGLDPNTGESYKGPLWGFGVLTGIEGDRLAPIFTAWVRSFADLFVLNESHYRHLPTEYPFVQAVVTADPSNQNRAFVRLKPVPSTATVKYVIQADGTSPPDRDSPLWLTMSTLITVIRNASADTLVYYYAAANGTVGPIESVRVAPGSGATLTLAANQAAGAAPVAVTFTATPDSLTRRIRWYRNTGANWPTLDNTSTGIPDPAKFTKETAIAAGAGGIYFDGSPAQGGTSDDGKTSRTGAAPTYANTTVVRVIAVPVDANGNAGAQVSLAYTVAASPAGKLTACTWLVTNAGTSPANPRKYTIAWTDDANVTTSYTLEVYSTVSGFTRTLVFTQANPVGTTSKTNQISQPKGWATAFGQDITVDFDYVLKDGGGAVVDSGTVTKSGGGSSTDEFIGDTLS